jgi:deaminated glutathione amidase
MVSDRLGNLWERRIVMAQWDGNYTWHKPPSSVGAPERLRVATCQIPVTFDIAENTGRIVELIEAAGDAGADVAHFPECAISGYGSANWPDWSGFDWEELDAAVGAVCDAARRCGIWVVSGCVHREPDGRTFNSVYAIDRNGAFAGRYDKRRCSQNDLRAFEPGSSSCVIDIEGTRCGILICRDWSFPELWQELRGGVELVFHSACSDNHGRDKNETHTIPPMMQSYARLHSYAVSSANSCRRSQDYPSFWVERSGHTGNHAIRHETGFTVNALADDPEQDRFFAAVRAHQDAERITAAEREKTKTG